MEASPRDGANEAQLIKALPVGLKSVKPGLIILCPGIFISGLSAGFVVPFPSFKIFFIFFTHSTPLKGGVEVKNEDFFMVIFMKKTREDCLCRPRGYWLYCC